MDLTRLTSALVRQTMVLIARLSTLGGVRSPLSRVADEVFLGLVRELERQGLGKKVAADMFGLALRSYQLKVQRLQESASDSGVTLWAAIRAFLEARGSVTRSQILAHFSRDEPANVRGILNDLVESGLVFRAGRGDSSVYRLTSSEDLARLAANAPEESAEALVWLVTCRDGPISADAIGAATGLSAQAVEGALSTLLASGQIVRSEQDAALSYDASRCLIPVGSEAGWEAALIDHHQAVVNAIAAKIQAGTHKSATEDRTGGSTYSFELWPGHPEEQAVAELLQATRASTGELWERVSRHNTAAGQRERDGYRVTFYVGQSVERRDEVEA